MLRPSGGEKCRLPPSAPLFLRTAHPRRTEGRKGRVSKKAVIRKTFQVVLPVRGTAPARPCRAIAAPCRSTTRRKAATGRRARRSGRGVLIVRHLRTHGGEKAVFRVSCLVKTLRPCCRRVRLAPRPAVPVPHFASPLGEKCRSAERERSSWLTRGMSPIAPTSDCGPRLAGSIRYRESTVCCRTRQLNALFQRGIGRTGLRYPYLDMTAIRSGTWFPEKTGIKPARRITFRNATPASGSGSERIHYKLSRAAPLNAKPDMFRDD